MANADGVKAQFRIVPKDKVAVQKPAFDFDALVIPSMYRTTKESLHNY